ncbi:M28 family metallopeptidase [Occallatibacter riparius]|uniref:M28 family metallopeptidase n=1 Tax=Occallatibacter riparius TaxID=1002689 RepID=A0A9J7BIN2_9BACT|nr:M28 family metallopeptidase [Occallatibacter riparius]UWZ82353.1 M28 family metallopeptidase [Occallatibacter riparius]
MSLSLLPFPLPAQAAAAPTPASVFGYSDFSKQAKIESKFLAVPDAKAAGEDLKTLTAEPHLAGTPEDQKTAEFVAKKFRAAGLDTEIVPYKVLMNQPKVVKVEAFTADGKPLMVGPQREEVPGDPFENNARVVMPFNGSSGSGDVKGDVVYANYGRLEDFDHLAEQHVDLHGKIVMVRYGQNFRGVKVYIAEQRGAAGVLIYSDPQDDGFFKGDAYPEGPWRPDSGVQRGSVQYLFKYPGDPETPGVASTADLPDAQRVNPEGNQPHIVSIPISYHDAAPILKALKGPSVPQSWQGALPFRYHVGPSGVKVHLVSQQDYQRRTIWDVIGKIKGTEQPDEWVVVGNHRDAWVYGAVDPNSGTAAMLESVHGVGALLKEGWRPKRTIVFASWDAEEEGLIGSTEWVEQHAQQLEHAVAYFNVDVAVSGPNFSAAAVPSLKQFVRQVAQAVPSPTSGETVYDSWRAHRNDTSEHRPANAPNDGDVRVGDLGSGSDFTPFLQHVGVPSTDIGSGGAYGVYHSVFDNYAWYTMNADPQFVYLQEMARVLGLEAIRMANTDVLPYDYAAYAREIASYLDAAKKKAADSKVSLDFAPALAAADRFAKSAQKARDAEDHPSGDVAKLNDALRQAEADLVTEAGLPNRPWYKHTIYAPGEYTGYAAVVIPGVNEAIEAKDPNRATQQLGVLTKCLDKAAQTLSGVR